MTDNREALPEAAGNDEEQELYEHHRFSVDPGQTPVRIDKFLHARLPGVSRSKVQHAAEADAILVNAKPVKSSYRIKPRDVISVVLPHPPLELEILPENLPIDIVFEDPHLIVIDKRPGMVVHPGYANYTGTLLNALLYHFRETGQEESARPYLVHRIDKDTSGILVVAKTEAAQARLSKYFFDHSIQRKYTALVWGDVGGETGTITGNLGRSIRNRIMMEVYPDSSQGRHAVTHYSVLERFGYVTLVECVLETGRTHQIRAHMKYIGHPLFSDALYGGNTILKGTSFAKYRQFVENCFSILPRQALHARLLGFYHPATGENICFESPLPPDMAAAIEKWRRYAAEPG